jgi:Lon protease-like protein
VLFPTTVIPLNVFEPRYRQMMADVLEADGLFGIALIRAGSEVGGPAVPAATGTIASIHDLDRRPDGTMGFLALGGQRFRILELLTDKPYLRGRVDLLLEDTAEPPQSLVTEVRESFFAYLEATSGLSGGALHDRAREATGRELSYLVASAIEAVPSVRQELLETDGHQERLQRELTLLQEETRLLKETPRSARMARFFNLN